VLPSVMRDAAADIAELTSVCPFVARHIDACSSTATLAPIR
jgi:hypothetical protein